MRALGFTRGLHLSGHRKFMNTDLIRGSTLVPNRAFESRRSKSAAQRGR
jgi:hypothetical protein